MGGRDTVFAGYRAIRHGNVFEGSGIVLEGLIQCRRVVVLLDDRESDGQHAQRCPTAGEKLPGTEQCDDTEDDPNHGNKR